MATHAQTKRLNWHLECPHCRLHLHEHDNRFECEHLHRFDKSEYGSLNLLKDPVPAFSGRDTRAMVQSRIRSFEAGYLDQLVHIVDDEGLQHAKSLSYAPLVLDAGCGPGMMSKSWREAGLQVIGVDLSADAVEYYSRQPAPGLGIVSNIKSRIPLLDQSVDIILSAFSPRNWVEFDRIGSRHCIVIVAYPSLSDLGEARSSSTIETREEKNGDILAKPPETFKKIKSQTFQYKAICDSDVVRYIVMSALLGPYIDEERPIENSDHISLDFHIDIFGRV